MASLALHVINITSDIGMLLMAQRRPMHTDISLSQPLPCTVPYIVSMQTDISPVVIDQMNEQHAKHFPALQHCVSDCRAMPEFKTGYFGAVIDKGARSLPGCSY